MLTIKNDYEMLTEQYTKLIAHFVKVLKLFGCDSKIMLSKIKEEGKELINKMAEVVTPANVVDEDGTREYQPDAIDDKNFFKFIEEWQEITNIKNIRKDNTIDFRTLTNIFKAFLFDNFCIPTKVVPKIKRELDKSFGRLSHGVWL